MAENVNVPTTKSVAVRLVDATGITEAQARDLISVLGNNWPSLIREANLLLRASRA